MTDEDTILSRTYGDEVMDTPTANDRGEHEYYGQFEE